MDQISSQNRHTKAMESPQITTITAFAWEARRSMITQLWRENKTIAEIQALLERDGFNVSKRMLQLRLSRWNLDKKNKESEIAAAARILFERSASGQRSALTIRGRKIDMAEIQRYAKRRKIDIDQLLALAPARTPSAIQCRTPSPKPMDAPEVYRVQDRLLRHAHSYAQSICDPSNLMSLASTSELDIISGSTASDSSYGIPSLINRAVGTFEEREISSAMDYIHEAMDRVPKAFLGKSPFMLPHIMERVSTISEIGHGAVSLLMVKHFSNIAEIHDPSRSGQFSQVCKYWLRSMYEENPVELMNVAIRLYADCVQQQLYQLFTGTYKMGKAVENSNARRKLLLCATSPVGSNLGGSWTFLRDVLAHNLGKVSYEVTRDEDDACEVLSDRDPIWCWLRKKSEHVEWIMAYQELWEHGYFKDYEYICPVYTTT